jgi:hypothetical protein
MIKTTIFLFFLCCVLAIQAQVTKTVNITSGGLSTVLTPEEKKTINHLTITGTIDARDFKTIKRETPRLKSLNLRNAKIEAYTGTGGPAGSTVRTYKENTIPERSFSEFSDVKCIESIILPKQLEAIDNDGLNRAVYKDTIYIPASVNRIGRYAFYGCSAITVDSDNPFYSSLDGVLYNKDQTELIHCPITKTGVFVIPQTVRTIGPNSFGLCRLLTKIILSPSVNKIEEYAFLRCESLQSINLPITLDTICEAIFRGCRKLTSVNIPAVTKFIGRYAFDDCRELKNVFIPYLVDTIDINAFLSIAGPITVDSKNQYFSSQDGILYNKEKTKVIQCTSSQKGTVHIPPTVTTIGRQAFYFCDSITSIITPPFLRKIEENGFTGCRSLTSISIPASVVSIGESAFSTCDKIKSIYVYSKKPVELGSNYYFFSHNKMFPCVLHVPEGSKELYLSKKHWKEFPEIIEGQLPELEN